MEHKQARIYISAGFYRNFHRTGTMYECQVAQGIGFLESRYGTAWLGAGVGSKNWGAVQKCKPPCPYDSFLYEDSNPNSDGTSTKYQICFKKYESDVDATADLIRIAFGTVEKPKPALAAAARGDLLGVSTAMYQQHYYSGFGATVSARIENHRRALVGAIKAQCLALGEPMPDGKPPLATQVGKVVGHLIPTGPVRTLKRGMRGDDVKAWQQTLNTINARAEGFRPLVVDGMMGSYTDSETKVFQFGHGLTPDGLVGKKTRAAATAALKQVA